MSISSRYAKIEETLNTYTHLYSNVLDDIINLIDEMSENISPSLFIL